MRMPGPRREPGFPIWQAISICVKPGVTPMIANLAGVFCQPKGA